MKHIFCILIIVIVSTGYSCRTSTNDQSLKYLEQEVQLINSVFDTLVRKRYPLIPPPLPDSTYSGQWFNKQENKKMWEEYENWKLRYEKNKDNKYPYYVEDSLCVFPIKELDYKINYNSKLKDIISRYSIEYLKLRNIKTKVEIDLSKLTSNRYLISKPNSNRELLTMGQTGCIRFSRVGFNNGFTRAILFYELYDDGWCASNFAAVVFLERIENVWKIELQVELWHGPE
jgi:hypothetical protein